MRHHQKNGGQENIKTFCSPFLFSYLTSPCLFFYPQLRIDALPIPILGKRDPTNEHSFSRPCVCRGSAKKEIKHLSALQVWREFCLSKSDGNDHPLAQRH